MALKKTITNMKGVTTEYHMISMLKKTFDIIDVTLKSYVDETYRELEKSIIDNIARKKELEQQALQVISEEEPDEELLDSLNKEISSLNIAKKDYSVDTIKCTISLDNEDDISFETIYEKLKNEAVFEDSEDC